VNEDYIFLLFFVSLCGNFLIKITFQEYFSKKGGQNLSFQEVASIRHRIFANLQTKITFHTKNISFRYVKKIFVKY
jgi:hypothetical protein